MQDSTLIEWCRPHAKPQATGEGDGEGRLWEVSRASTLKRPLVEEQATSEHQQPATMIIQLAARGAATACALWMLAYCLAGGTATGKAFFGSLFLDGDKAGVPLFCITFPILAAGLVAALGVRLSASSELQHNKAALYNHQSSSSWPRLVQRRILTPATDGDPDYAKWAWWCLILPCLVLAACSIHRHLYDGNNNNDDSDDDGPPAQQTVMEVGNSFGYAAVVALSVQLVPVARHGPLLRLWSGAGWNAAVTVQLHAWLGRCVVFLVAGHAAFHLYRYSGAPHMLGENVLRMMIPPVQCFWYGEGGDFRPTCQNQETECTCYQFVRNFTGMLAGVALVTIGLSSMNCVRRTAYAVFYKIHVVAGPTMLLLVVLHWNRSILFLAGSALYYAACSFPVLWEQQRKERQSGGGLRIAAVERIESSSSSGSRPCVAVTLVASDVALRRYRAGQYVQLKAPSISSISHPFSINTIPADPNQLRIIFRCVGPFTRRLGEELLNGAAAIASVDNDTGRTDPGFPNLYLDGFYGSPDRLEQVLQHDVVVLVAGGIGITPYLSLLHQVHSIATTHSFLTTKKLVLHWSCRDPYLIAYVKREYWDPLLSDTSASTSLAKLRIHIIIHNTNAEDANEALRLGSTGNPRGYEDDENDPTECSVELEEVRSSRRHNDSLTVSTGASAPKDELGMVQLEERKGRRATVHQFLHAFEVAQRPGLFACGPSALLQDLRDATRERCLMRLRRCATAGEPTIALYEETFEM